MPNLFPGILTDENFPEIVIENSAVCFYCKSSPIPENITYCPQCKFPQHGSPEEQKEFIQELRDKVKEHTRLEEIIGWSQTILFFTGLTALVAGFVFFLNFRSTSFQVKFPLKDLIIIVAAVTPNFILYFWSKKKPFPAILLALCLTTLGAINQLIFYPFSQYVLLFSLLIILVFVHGLLSYNDAVKIEKELLVAPKEFEVRNAKFEVP